MFLVPFRAFHAPTALLMSEFVAEPQDRPATNGQDQKALEDRLLDSLSSDEYPRSDGQSDLSLREQAQEAIGRSERSPEEKIRALLQVGLDWFDLEAGFLAKIDLAESVHRTVVAAGTHPGFQKGMETDLPDTYCREVVTRAPPLMLEDAGQQGWGQSPAYQRYDLSCYLGTKVIVEGQFYGTVCFGSRTPNSEPTGPEDETALELVAQLAGHVIAQGRRQRETDQLRDKYKLLLEAAPNAIVLADIDTGRIVDTNQKAADLIGASEEELTGRPQTALHPDGEADRYRRLFQECCQPGLEGTADQFEDGSSIYVQTDSGEKVPVEISAATVELGDQRLAVGIFRDITERRRRKRRLERQNDLFNRAQEIADVGGWDYDVQTGTLRWTPEVYRIHGRSPEAEPALDDVISYYHPDDRPKLEEAVTDAIENGVPYDLELRLCTETGEERWVRTRGEPQREDGTVSRVRGTIQDITEQHKVEEELRDTKRFYEQVLKETPIDLAVFGADGRFEYVNSQSVGDPEVREWLIGHTNEEYCRKRDLDPELGKRRDRAIRTAVQEKRTTELEERLETDQGTVSYLRVHSPVTNVEGEVTHVAAYGVNITERKRREHALRERQGKIEALYEATRHVLTAERPAEISDRIHELLGHLFDYPLRSIGFVDGPVILPERTVMECPDVPSPGPRPRSGSSLSANALRIGDTIVAEDASTLDNDVEYGPLRSTAAVPIGEEGVVVIGKTTVEDFDPFNLRLIEILSSYAALVLERLDQEETLRRAKKEAEEAAQLKSAMLANMSHEIRTPLTSIIGFAEALGEKAQQDETSSRFAELIEKSGRRLLYTLDGVLTLSKLEAGRMELDAQPIDLVDQVRDVAGEFHSKAEEKGLDLQIDTGGASACARADTGGVQIVLQNLLSNAIKYTEDGQVHIQVREEERSVVVAVEDTGIGMDPARAEKLFEPFRQRSEGLSRAYEGTGLGLAVTKRAVNQMGGHVEVETEKGEGSRFTVRFPKPGSGEGDDS